MMNERLGRRRHGQKARSRAKPSVGAFIAPKVPLYEMVSEQGLGTPEDQADRQSQEVSDKCRGEPKLTYDPTGSRMPS